VGETGEASAKGSRGVVGRFDCRDVVPAATYGGGAVATESGRGNGSGVAEVTPRGDGRRAAVTASRYGGATSSML
jgi:hypothetical protein